MKIILKILLGILKWGGILILGILAALILVMLIPVSFSFLYYDRKFRAELNLICFKIKLGGKKKEKNEDSPDKNGEEPEKKEENKSEKRQSRFKATPGIVWDVLNDAGTTLKWLLKHIDILDIDVEVPISAGDPFLTGSILGAAWSAAGNVMPLLAKLFRRTTYIRMDFNPIFDPLGEPPAPRVGAVIHGTPFTILIAGIIIFIKYLKILNKAEKENKNVTEQ